jgi:2-dehydro-3-deoxy-D-arabinonate dehydratase
MKIYNTTNGVLLEKEHKLYQLDQTIDELLTQENLFAFLSSFTSNPLSQTSVPIADSLPPIGSQEIWASGVTYFKSREARMDESKDAGGGDFYDRVYYADRPELFMKSAPFRAVGTGQEVYIRKDSKWNVPEPELTLVINPKGAIVGYTIGNDMSSRDIEGENPLYLPQAKCYDKAAAIGPCIFITNEPLDKETCIKVEIVRSGSVIFAGEINISQIKRTFSELVHYLYLEMSYPKGAFLMTGTGVVPPNEITLMIGDEIRISIDQIGTLVNYVNQRK